GAAPVLPPGRRNVPPDRARGNHPQHDELPPPALPAQTSPPLPWNLVLHHRRSLPRLFTTAQIDDPPPPFARILRRLPRSSCSGALDETLLPLQPPPRLRPRAGLPRQPGVAHRQDPRTVGRPREETEARHRS